MQIYHARHGAQSPCDSIALEQRINAELRRLIGATSRCDQLAAWQSMVALIGERGPQRIAEMERARGLLS
jgi:lipase chaperone LimK